MSLYWLGTEWWSKPERLRCSRYSSLYRQSSTALWLFGRGRYELSLLGILNCSPENWSQWGRADSHLFKAGMHESPHIHGSHFPAGLTIVVDNPGEHVAHHAGRQQLHPPRHLLRSLLLLLRQTQQTPTDGVLPLPRLLPDDVLQGGAWQALQGGNCLTWITLRWVARNG